MQRSPTCENCQKNFELREYQPIGPRIPLLLSCGHTFCEGCLTKAARLHQEIPCFTCNEKQTLKPIGEKGVANLLPNIYMLGILLFNRRAAGACAGNQICGGNISSFSGIGNTMQTQAGNEEELAQTVAITTQELCDECSVKEATSLCKKCDDSKFCDSCFVKIHRASKTLNKHNPLPLDLSSEEVLTCSIHDERSLEFFDLDLKKPVCARCIITEECKGHKIVPINEMEHTTEDCSLDEAAENVKNTLFWFENSKKLLTKSLQDEVSSSYQLVSNIQQVFSELHTLLIKRQLEVMNEASMKVCKEANAHKQIQQITVKIKEIKRSIKDYEMIKDNKRVRKLKGGELLKKLNDLASQPCIIQRSSNETLNDFSINDELIDSIKKLGTITEGNVMYDLVKPEDLDEQTKESIKQENQSTDRNAVQENEVYQQKFVPKKATPLMAPLQGHCELVYITHVKDPLNFMVQRCADKDRLQVMMTALNKHCRHTNDSQNRIYHIEDGNIVCAQFSADNNWYRAQCISAFCPSKPDIVPSYNNNLPVEVLYIDYGNTEWLPLNRLRQIKDQFLEIPSMAVNCSLMDIVPPFKAVVWPERSVKAFNSLTGERPMLMNIRERVPGKLLVDLRRPDDEEPTQDDDRPVSVRDALVFLDVACFFSPSSFPNADVHKSVRDYSSCEPFKEKEFVDVTVTHMQDYCHVFLQRLDTPIMEEQKHLTKLYQGRNKRAWKIEWPYRNLVCAARFSGDKTWYRAKVKNVNHDETVLVEYVDYGNEEALPFHDIKKIPEMYLRLPRQCLKAKLDGVEMAVEGKEEIKTKIIDFFESTVMNEALVCLTKGIDADGLPTVCLFDTSTEQDININELAVKVDSIDATKESENKQRPTIDSIPVSVSSSQSSLATASVDELKNLVTSSHSSQSSVVASPTPPRSQPEPKKAFAQYLPAEMPSENEFQATGVYVDDEGKIYLHLMIDDFKLERIMQDLNRDQSAYKKAPKDTSGLNVGQALLTKFSQDGFWYRTKVLEILSSTIVKVEFIDFGNIEDACVNQLCLNPKYLDVPSQCVAVRLANIVPPDNRKRWGKKAIDLIKERIEEKEVTIKMEGTKAFVIVDKEDLSLMLVTSGNAEIRTEEKQPDMKSSEATSSDERSALISPFEKLFSPIKSPTSITLTESSPDVSPPRSHSAYTKQQLPSIGCRFDVTVTQVEKPNRVYIQRYPASDGETLFADDSDDVTAESAYHELALLDELSYTINEDYENQERITSKVVKGMACIGRYSSDSQNYRAVVESVSDAEGIVDLIYVDYGTRDTVPIESLRSISSNVLSLPRQATEVEIVGIKPLLQESSSSTSSDHTWPMETLKSFFAMVANKRLIAQVVDDLGEIPKIHLYDRCLREDSNSGETADVPIAKIMAENKLSIFELDDDEEIFVQF